MPYEYLEDIAIADIAFRAWAPELEGTFVAAADATLNVMIEDLSSVRPLVRRPVELRDESLEMLLFGLLNEIVYRKDADLLLLRVPEVRIGREGKSLVLEAVAAGETLDLARHSTRVDVKAVTLYRFALGRTPAGWEATVVLDV